LKEFQELEAEKLRFINIDDLSGKLEKIRKIDTVVDEMTVKSKKL